MDWNQVWQAFWVVTEVFLFFAYLIILFHIISDLFRDRRAGGFAKAVWVFFLIFAPFITALIYLIARGSGMAERQAEAMKSAQQSADSYIREVAGTSPAQQIETAKGLLDSGAITAKEFSSLKAAALTKA